MRLKGYDYSCPGIYYVTILTEGGISSFGKIIHKNWITLPMRFESVLLLDYIIMPDHLHGIIVLNQPSKDAINRVSSKSAEIQTKNLTSAYLSGKYRKNQGGITKSENPMISQNTLSYYIRWFKGKCTYQIRKKYPKLRFSWHPGYYDRIIRDKKTLYMTKKYIQNNPNNWIKKSIDRL
jgi:REP element-mobilizing transposase RayT